MKELAQQKIPDVAFPRVEWDEVRLMPKPEDLYTYTSQVHHAALSINAASTVTLEFLLLDKPVINLDFDPPGTKLHPAHGYARHIRFDHFLPVAESGATMVAKSSDELKQFIERGLKEPEADSAKRKAFVQKFFEGTADGHAGERVAECLLELARRNVRKK
jgi:CDP-glycerol glycerophosphotransferase (TagB/SpsB family)